MSDEKLLLEARPSWWKFFWHLLFFWLLLIPLAVALWKRASLVLRVYDDRISLRRGLFGREVRDVFIADVRTIEVRQSFLQRLVGIGDLEIDTAAADEDEITAAGLPRPQAIKDLILRQRRQGKGSSD